MKNTLIVLICLLFNFYIHSQAPLNGLVAHWPLDGNFDDSGSLGINGLNSGTTSTSNVFAVANKAMNFSNSNATSTIVNQYATHTSKANLNFTQAQDFSIDYNVYFSGPYIHPGGIYDNGLNYGGYGIFFWEGNGFLEVKFIFMNSSVGTTNGALNYNTWYHITTVKAGNILKIYINGVLNITGNVGSTTPNYTNVVPTFGAMFFNGYSPPRYNGLNGNIDELRIYNRSLTDNEILSLYQFTSLGTQNFNFQSNRLILYPNPTKNVINFSETSELNGKGFRVVDLSGKTMLSGKLADETCIDVSRLSIGIYLLKVEGEYASKFLKE
ncbi:LamG domain-containing protein [Flavobacterium franklandianum]|uniref:T9SS type A sorting domain-containing protein n=1 Tax=Flavobacterium franklandianum TaxID=2594430 RepID=A0A553C626_9FLAO|nr:LamG domain-containing protein [Flavobacterium franklandianum]TRX15948.1 T9SS type A sorting domain-containing protein [Flavobacterium franklandianum]